MTPAKQRILIFTIAGVSALACMVFVGVFIAHTIHSVQHPAAATGEERRLLVTTETLKPFGVKSTGGRAENITSTRQFDGSRDIQYTYSSKTDPQASETLYVLSKVQVLPQSLTAMQVFKMEQLAIRAGVQLQGKAQLVPRPELVTFGDQRYAASIERDGKPAGNLFIIRQGRVVHMLTIGGFYFDSAGSVERLFKPILEETRRQFP
jgi:hypothetical protein